MAALTIDQALKQGIEAHKAGQVQDADHIYTAILKAQPKHPDANHNMGVLAVGAGKVEQALPFFKTALETNPSTAQFWLSYIDALIKLHQGANAKAVLDLARSKGAKGNGFDQLEKRLQEANPKPLEASKIASEAKPMQPNILNTLKLDQAINLAKKKTQEGSTEEAKRIYHDILSKFPKNKRARDGVKGLAGKSADKASNVQDPPQDQLQSLMHLYTNGRLDLVIEYAQVLTKQYPEAFAVWNLMGASAAQIGQLDQAIFAYKKILNIKPNYAVAYYNMGVILQEQGKLEEATKAYRTTLAIKPDHADAYSNMGVILQRQGMLEEAVEAYNKALAIKPDYANAYYNMGNALRKQDKLEEAIEAYNKALANKPDHAEAQYNTAIIFEDQGKLEEAIEAYNKALAIKPDYADANKNSLTLTVQLLPIIANYGHDFNINKAQVNSEVMLGPMYQIQHLIKTFLEENFSKAHFYGKNFKACNRKLLDKMKQKDKIFCNAYSIFIGKLLEANWDEEPASENKVYHLGESHCLSFAHRNITIGGTNFRITPRIIFGAKAFHFARTKHDKFKAITKAHFVSLPRSSKVFLSFGEIDCRPNEGFIAAARNLDKPLEELIDQTVGGYVQWFSSQNANLGHQLYFINVPAPVYNKKHSADLNSEVTRTVVLFNTALKKYSLRHGFDMVDVFKFTASNEGFSNGLFHVDNIHLGAQARLKIEQQLS